MPRAARPVSKIKTQCKLGHSFLDTHNTWNVSSARMKELPKNIKPGTVAVVGIPFDAHSSFMKGAASAPARIRKVWSAGASNMCSESGIDLGNRPDLIDVGDIELDKGSDSIAIIEKSVTELLFRDIRVLSLGGDHAVTYPILKAYSKKYDRFDVLQCDAHPDLYDSYEGNRYSHACPFARIMEENLASRLVQVGIRSLTPHQRQQAERFGVEIIEMRNGPDAPTIHFENPVYLSIDLDVIDPAFAPGVAHHEPGGMSTRQLVDLIQRLTIPILGADIVEFNPKRDSSEITAMVAVKLLKEVAARMLELPYSVVSKR